MKSFGTIVLTPRLRITPARFQEIEHIIRQRTELPTTSQVDGSVPGGSHSPCQDVIRFPKFGSGFERRENHLLENIIRSVNVAHNGGCNRSQPEPFAEQNLDDHVRFQEHGEALYPFTRMNGPDPDTNRAYFLAILNPLGQRVTPSVG